MDNSDSDELGQVLGIGEHCSVEHCRQVDFLPFKCDCCYRIFCLEHRSYAAHVCPKAGAKETTVIVCPICAKSVRLAPGQDANAAFDVHQRSDCDPSNYERVHKKPRCPVGGCKEKLTMINTYRCKHCNQRVCLKHRDPGDHRCAEAQAALRNQRGATYGTTTTTTTPNNTRASGSGRSSGNTSAGSSRPPSAPRVAAASSTPAAAGAAAPAPAPSRRADPQQLHAAALRQYEDPANSLRGTAERRIALLQQQQLAEQQRRQQQQRWPWQSAAASSAPQPATAPTAAPVPAPAPAPAQPYSNSAAGIGAGGHHRSGTPGSNANPLVPPHLPEQCPQCGAKFATVERLIQHVEDFHPADNTTITSSPFAAGVPAAAAAPESGQAFVNPLRGLLSSTIAGGEAPAGAGAGGGGWQGGPTSVGGGGGGGGAGPGGAAGREVYRCYHCGRTFHDPVLLVQHADRCAAATGTAVGGTGPVQGSGGGGSGGGSSKDNCVVS